jgi:large subunit ribosomal protein L32e
MATEKPKKKAAKKKAKKKVKKAAKKKVEGAGEKMEKAVAESSHKKEAATEKAPVKKKAVKKTVKKKAVKKKAVEGKAAEKGAVEKKAPGQEVGEAAEAVEGEAPVKEKKPKVKKEKPIVKIKHLPKSGQPQAKRKPRFIRQELNKLPRLGDKWRKPRGIDSKKHEKKRGKGRLPSIGFKKTKGEASLHYGFEAVRVFNIRELSEINPGKEAAVIASSVGRRKRNMIIEKANELKITVLNPRAGET